MTKWQTEKLSNLLAVSIGGIWGEEAGKAEVDVAVVRVTELKAHGRIDPSSAVTRSVSLKQLASRELQEGDLLLEKSGGGPNSPVGRVGYFSQEGTRTVCSNFMQLMRPDSSKVLPKYLFHFLDGFHSNGGTIPMQTATTNIRNIKTPQYMDIEVPIPLIDEQYKIVELLEDHLSRLDAASEYLSSSRKSLERLELSWLQSKLVSQNDEFGYIRFGDAAETKLGKMLDAKNNVGIETPYLGNINVRWGYIETETLKTVPLTQSNREHLLLEENDLLICEGGEPGRCAIWRPKDNLEVAFQKALHRARAKSGFQIEFLQLVIEYSVQSGSAKSFFTGTTIKHLPQEKLREIPVPNISLPQQKVICDEAEFFQALVSHLKNEIAFSEKKVQALRKTLLESAFTGQLTNEVVSV